MSLAAKAGSLLVRAGKLLTNCLCCCVGQCPSGVSECQPQCACTGGNCVPCRNTACPNGQQDCGTGCTCSGGQCVGCRETACPNGDECGEGCSCVDGECVSGCYVAYCCSPDGQCGPNGDGCADFLGCQERWNAPAFFATGAEAQEFADNFNADNPSWQFGCGMYVFTEPCDGNPAP